MTPFAIAMLALSMSADAFVVSIGRGAALGRPRFTEALRTGAIFGTVEALTPLIGWAAGFAASRFLEAIDHWIAFGLLGAVGLHMLIAAVRRRDDDGEEEKPPVRASLPVLIVTAIGTSLDAMAVGVSLAFLNVNIIIIALSIGMTTFIMSSGGIMVGRLLSERWGRVAEAGAGFVLIGVGLSILIQHLSA